MSTLASNDLLRGQNEGDKTCYSVHISDLYSKDTSAFTVSAHGYFKCQTWTFPTAWVSINNCFFFPKDVTVFRMWKRKAQKCTNRAPGGRELLPTIPSFTYFHITTGCREQTFTFPTECSPLPLCVTMTVTWAVTRVRVCFRRLWTDFYQKLMPAGGRRKSHDFLRGWLLCDLPRCINFLKKKSEEQERTTHKNCICSSTRVAALLFSRMKVLSFEHWNDKTSSFCRLCTHYLRWPPGSTSIPSD